MDVSDFTISEETLKFFENEFRRRDTDKSGTIDCGELEECLQMVGFLPTKQDVEFLQKHFDTSGNGKLEIRELVNNINVICAHSLQGNQLMEAFQRLDPSNTGFIRECTLKKVLTHNDNMSWNEAEEYISKLVEKYDINRDGKFDYAEFARIMVCEDDPLKERCDKKA